MLNSVKSLTNKKKNNILVYLILSCLIVNSLSIILIPISVYYNINLLFFITLFFSITVSSFYILNRSHHTSYDNKLVVQLLITIILSNLIMWCIK